MCSMLVTLAATSSINNNSDQSLLLIRLDANEVLKHVIADSLHITDISVNVNYSPR